MSQRSLKSSVTGQQRAKQAMKRKGWTQNYLAIEAGLSTRNSVWKFLSGRSVERHIFMELCFQLDLEWQDIADLDGAGDDSDELETPAIVSEPNGSTFEAIKAQLKTYFVAITLI
jgi:predicted NACHT family NTPase